MWPGTSSFSPYRGPFHSNAERHVGQLAPTSPVHLFGLAFPLARINPGWIFIRGFLETWFKSVSAKGFSEPAVHTEDKAGASHGLPLSGEWAPGKDRLLLSRAAGNTGCMLLQRGEPLALLLLA